MVVLFVSFVVRRRRGDRKSNRTDFVVVVVLDDDGEEEDEEEEEALQNDPPRAREKATLDEKRREDMMLKAQSYGVSLRSQQSTTNGEIVKNTSPHKTTSSFSRGRKEYTERGSSETIRKV